MASRHLHLLSADDQWRALTTPLDRCRCQATDPSPVPCPANLPPTQTFESHLRRDALQSPAPPSQLEPCDHSLQAGTVPEFVTKPPRSVIAVCSSCSCLERHVRNCSTHSKPAHGFGTHPLQPVRERRRHDSVTCVCRAEETVASNSGHRYRHHLSSYDDQAINLWTTP